MPDIYLHPGAVQPTDIWLRDPTTYASIIDKIFAGNVQAVMIPSMESIVDGLYNGSVAFQNAPQSTISTVTALYTGVVGFDLIPLIESELSAAYQGAVGVAFIQTGIYSGGGTQSYTGDIQAVLIPTSTNKLRMVYAGDMPVGFVNSVEAALQKQISGNIGLELLPVSSLTFDWAFRGAIPVSFATVGDDVMIPDETMTCTPFILPGRNRMFAAWHMSAAKVFAKKGQSRIKTAKKQIRTLTKKGKKRIFEVKHGK